MLYEDTEFGRQAEDAFRRQLHGLQLDNYLALPYRPPNVRKELRQILDKRPEAVGVFGGREDIVAIARDLRQMNARGTPFRPVLFTVLDIRALAQDSDGFYFVSVIRPPDRSAGNAPDRYDDVEGLSYDTTGIVLDEIEKMGADGCFDKKRFRDRFVGLLDGALDEPASRTGMRFSGMANSSALHIYQIDGGRVTLKENRDVDWLEKLKWKWELMFKRFGFAHFLVALTIFLTVSTTAVHDIYRWYGGGFGQLLFGRRFLSGPFLSLVAIQFLVATILYVFLAETGRIRWDSMLNGFIIALAPSPLLRANFANVGHTRIGFADAYDRLLKHLTKKLLLVKYKDVNAAVLVLAYYNSMYFLKRTVTEIYSSIPNQDEAKRLRAEMEEELESYTESIDKRKALSRRLVEVRTWEELYRMNAVPRSMRREVKNPERMIADGVQYCIHNDQRKQKLKALIDRHLDGASSTVVKHHDTKVREAENSPRDQLFVQLQFLVMVFAYDEAQLRNADLFPPSGEVAEIGDTTESTVTPDRDVAVEVTEAFPESVERVKEGTAGGSDGAYQVQKGEAEK